MTKEHALEILAPRDSRKYNVADKKGCERGSSLGSRPKPALIYSLVGIDGNRGICQSWSVRGELYEEKLLLENLEIYNR